MIDIALQAQKEEKRGNTINPAFLVEVALFTC